MPRISRRRDVLTGGTKDVNPQFMNLALTTSAADTFTQSQTQIPIQRLQNAGRAQVMEVLKIWMTTTQLIPAVATQTSHQVIASLTTKSMVAMPLINESTLFAYYEKFNTSAFTAAGTGTTSQELEPFILDLTDNAGHGFLVGSDNIYLQLTSTAQGIVVVAGVKILYRWKDVSIQEYVGIVQGQS